MKLFAAPIALLSLALLPWDNPAPAGWGSCSAAVAAPRYSGVRSQKSGVSWVWKHVPGAPNQLALNRNGVHIGSYDLIGKFYRPRLGHGKWGPVSECPVRLPKSTAHCPSCGKGVCCPKCPVSGGECNCGEACECIVASKTKSKVPPDLNFGVVEELIGPGPKYICPDKGPISRDEALSLVKKGAIPDDGAKSFLTIIGTPDERKGVLNDLATHAALSGIKDLVRLQAYDPDNWAVKDVGFVTTGHPTIYCQSLDGTVLHRQDDYQGGPEALAMALAKTNIRKPDPLNNPPKDPDKRRPEPLFPGAPSIPWPAYGLAGLAALVCFFPKR